MLRTYSHNQTQLMQAPAATAVLQVDLPAAQQLLAQALSEGREMLAAHEALAVLAAYGIPVAAMRKVAAEPVAAAEAAAALGFPVVLKVLSEQINHKSDVGGVVLNLDDAAAVEQAATAMLARVQRLKPLAVVEGFAVQAMVLRPQSQELIVGASIDPTFGPVLLFGQGGTAVEVLADRAMALPPLNEPLARALVQRTRVAKLLAGYRDTPAIDHAALYRVLMAVSQMLVDLPELAELDINPLLASAQGVVALDGRIRVSAGRPAGAAHFAIKPYPAQLEERVQWQGQPLLLRPIRPEDEAQHLAFLERLDPEDVRMRIFYSRRSIARSELARLTQIDYARETAFIATRQGEQGEETLGVARALADPDNVNAEFGVIVRSDLKGQGLGRLLMDKLVLALRQQGTQKLVATVLQNNTRMLELGTALGLKLAEGQDEPGERRLEMVL
jgi:acetyltransferase